MQMASTSGEAMTAIRGRNASVMNCTAVCPALGHGGGELGGPRCVQQQWCSTCYTGPHSNGADKPAALRLWTDNPRPESICDCELHGLTECREYL